MYAHVLGELRCVRVCVMCVGVLVTVDECMHCTNEGRWRKHTCMCSVLVYLVVCVHPPFVQD